MPARALVLGGAGMLSGVESHLVARGWHVVLPSRRYQPIPAQGSGRATWVHATPREPDRLAAAVGKVLDGHAADLLVSWVAAVDRRRVLDAVAPLLADQAPIVDVCPPIAAVGDAAEEPALPGHPTHRVILGHIGASPRTRALTQGQIADGINHALRRALAGLPPSVHQVGGLDRAPSYPRNLEAGRDVHFVHSGR